MEGVRDLYVARGIILKPVDLTDLFLYVAYDNMRGTANDWGMKPGGMAFAKACTRAFEPDGQQYLQQWWIYQSGRNTEGYYRGKFAKTGLLVSESNDIAAQFARSSQHVSPEIFGEITPTVGRSLNAEYEGYDGIILIGPFNCLPFRISEAILKPLSMQHGIPLLTYETDGCLVSPSVLRQVDVHIQRVLEHAAKTHAPSTLMSGKLSGLLESALNRSSQDCYFAAQCHMYNAKSIKTCWQIAPGKCDFSLLLTNLA